MLNYLFKIWIIFCLAFSWGFAKDPKNFKPNQVFKTDKVDPQTRGLELMKKNKALPQAKSFQSHSLMRIYKDNHSVLKEFENLNKKGIGRDYLLFSFLKPTRLKLLIHSYPNRADDQWLRLSSGKIKRIRGRDRERFFVNSHFCYEELQSTEIEKYHYKFLREIRFKKWNCFQVEAQKKQDKIYDKLIYYLRKSDYFVVRVDFFQKGKFIKYLEKDKIKKINNILTPFLLTMQLPGSQDKTVIELKSIKYNLPLKDYQFSKGALR